MTFPSGRFCWFEYVSKDAAKAQGLYGELFHWKTQSMPAPGLPGGQYTMIAAGEHTIGGYVPAPPGAPAHATWLAHLQVESAAKTVAAIEAAGGSVKMAPQAMGDLGTYAVVADPKGGVFALWQPRKPEAAEYRGVAGTWCWNELYTDAPEASVAFYATIGGFTDAPMDMGPMGTYHVLESAGKPRAGVMTSPMPGIPQHWLPYVQVASTDDTAARAKRLGFELVVPPDDIPNVGRFSVLRDPQGAAIGILQPAPASP
ncbi:MAG: VOC family protein [Myxococcales bacterium]|nr:VOC family protein [Myxococcales bacterium]